uniref:Uncharacterized protein n=1 Tax=Arundo donax TaxID=35708 RepID=A0A0A9HS00_ARUDO
MKLKLINSSLCKIWHQ